MPDPNMPELPSFKSSQEEKKGSSGSLPGVPSNNPILRLRGSGNGATTLVDRLKQLKKKDLAFIASGLSVLLTAPLAEHFMLNPNKESNVLHQGFDNKGAPFTEASPYEPGNGGFAPGGSPGQGSDVITPLNVRDPSALVMGPGAAQQPTPSAAGAGGAGQPEGGGKNWRDAIGEASRAGAARAAEAAGLPAPRGALAGALRGLSSLTGASGGGGPSYTLPPISQSNVPNRGGPGRSFITVDSAPGYGGVAPRGLATGGGASLEALRQAAAAAGNQFPRNGSAANNLVQAAQTAIPTGGVGYAGGGPNSGANNPNPAGNSTKENKTIGESLAYLKAKMIQEKQIELQYKIKDWLEFERAKEMQEQIIKAFIENAFAKPLGAVMDNFDNSVLAGLFGNGQYMFCQRFDPPTSNNVVESRTFPMSDWNSQQGPQKNGPSGYAPGYYSNEIAKWAEEVTSGTPGVVCSPVGFGAAATSPNRTPPPVAAGSVPVPNPQDVVDAEKAAADCPDTIQSDACKATRNLRDAEQGTAENQNDGKNTVTIKIKAVISQTQSLKSDIGGETSDLLLIAKSMNEANEGLKAVVADAQHSNWDAAKTQFTAAKNNITEAGGKVDKFVDGKLTPINTNAANLQSSIDQANAAIADAQAKINDAKSKNAATSGLTKAQEALNLRSKQLGDVQTAAKTLRDTYQGAPNSQASQSPTSVNSAEAFIADQRKQLDQLVATGSNLQKLGSVTPPASPPAQTVIDGASNDLTAGGDRTKQIADLQTALNAITTNVNGVAIPK